MDLQKVINNLKQLADYCDSVTSGNVSHKIAHLKYAIINIVESLELSSHKDKEMTLDEAIQHAQEVANKGCDQCAKDHQQLADWLKELKELRELGWHPTSELPNMCEEVVTWVNHEDGAITVSRGLYVGWPEEIINKLRWCYPPEKD